MSVRSAEHRPSVACHYDSGILFRVFLLLQWLMPHYSDFPPFAVTHMPRRGMR